MGSARSIVLALGGGGARGLAHLGIIRTLGERNIRIAGIAGSSMGAIIGAAYASHPDIDALERSVRALFRNTPPVMPEAALVDGFQPDQTAGFMGRLIDTVRSGYFQLLQDARVSIFASEPLAAIVNSLVPDMDISKTRIPFVCVATDITHGRPHTFTKGSLRRAVLASAAIPGLFPPVSFNGAQYSDGGAVSMTPVDAARSMKLGRVAACDVKSTPSQWDLTANARDIVARANYITGSLLNNEQLARADFYLAPDIKSIRWYEFARADEIIAAGSAAAIKVSLDHRRRSSGGVRAFLRGIFSKRHS